MSGPFVSQAEFARHRGVSRKTVTKWKHEGLLAIRGADGRVNQSASDQRLDDHGRGGAPVTTPDGRLPGNSTPGNSYPLGFEVLDLIDDPFEAGVVSMGLEFFYRSGPRVAALAVAAGASCEVAYSLEKAFRFSMLLHLEVHAARVGSANLQDALETDFIQVGALAETNWPELARLAGEPFDLDAWQAHYVGKFGHEG